MIGVVVVTHGQLATELLNAAEMIVGDLPRFAAVSIGWHDDVTDAREDIAQATALDVVGDRVRCAGRIRLSVDTHAGGRRQHQSQPMGTVLEMGFVWRRRCSENVFHRRTDGLRTVAGADDVDDSRRGYFSGGIPQEENPRRT